MYDLNCNKFISPRSPEIQNETSHLHKPSFRCVRSLSARSKDCHKHVLPPEAQMTVPDVSGEGNRLQDSRRIPRCIYGSNNIYRRLCVIYVYIVCIYIVYIYMYILDIFNVHIYIGTYRAAICLCYAFRDYMRVFFIWEMYIYIYMWLDFALFYII